MENKTDQFTENTHNFRLFIIFDKDQFYSRTNKLKCFYIKTNINLILWNSMYILCIFSGQDSRHNINVGYETGC